MQATVNCYVLFLSIAIAVGKQNLNIRKFDYFFLVDDIVAGLLGSQLNKHRLQSKFEHQQPQQPPQPPPQQQHNPNLLQNSSNQQSSRLQNHFQPSSSVDDDLGFDPFFETQKGLAELLENEMIQQQSQPNHSKLLDNCQRSRMPPPGFNHMNAFGFGVPRAAQTSKILPFMNMGNGNNGMGMTGSQQGGWSHQQQQQQPHQNMSFSTHDQMSNHLGQNHQSSKQGRQHCCYSILFRLESLSDLPLATEI